MVAAFPGGPGDAQAPARKEYTDGEDPSQNPAVELDGDEIKNKLILR
jgi:hypothetical protein